MSIREVRVVYVAKNNPQTNKYAPTVIWYCNLDDEDKYKDILGKAYNLKEITDNSTVIIIRGRLLNKTLYFNFETVNYEYDLVLSRLRMNGLPQSEIPAKPEVVEESVCSVGQITDLSFELSCRYLVTLSEQTKVLVALIYNIHSYSRDTELGICDVRVSAGSPDTDSVKIAEAINLAVKHHKSVESDILTKHNITTNFVE